MRFPKPHNSSLRQHNLLYFETALILSLATFIALFKLPLLPDSGNKLWVPNEKEILHLEGIIATRHTSNEPAPPPDVHVPISPPRDEILEAHLQDLDIEFSIPNPLPLVESKKEIPKKTTETSINTMPTLIGGMAKLQRNIVYPSSAVRDKIEGRVIVEFIVDEKGKVHNPKIIKGIRDDVNLEALKAITNAKFLPARKMGKPIPIEQVLYILFRLEQNS